MQAKWLRSPAMRWMARLPVMAIELGLWFLLIKTYSRGALVAVGAAGLFWIVTRRGKMGWVVPMIRIVSIAVLLFATDAVRRAEPGYVAADRSVSNRIDLWIGGLQMVALRPFTGWGQGESGPHYMHWFQNVDATEGYAGMVNSYLHRAVEHGLFALAPWLLLPAWILLSCLLYRDDRFPALLLAAAASSLVAFAVANFFSTLWVFVHLWWVPALAVGLSILLIAGCAWNNKRYRIAVARSAVVALAMTAVWMLSMVMGGSFLSRQAAVSVRDGILYLGAESMETDWLMLPDPAVFGRDYGKEVRRLAQVLNPAGIRLAVPLELEQVADARFTVDTILLSGRYSTYRLEYASQGSRLILVHPTGEAPAGTALDKKEVVLLRPMIDPNRHGNAWQELAADRQWHIESSGAIGIDARPVWPDMLHDTGIVDP